MSSAKSRDEELQPVRRFNFQRIRSKNLTSNKVIIELNPDWSKSHCIQGNTFRFWLSFMRLFT